MGVTALTCFTVFWSRPACAGGYEYGLDNGAFALSRAGAATAISGQSAIYSNVAGVADTPRFSLFASGNIVFRQLEFQRLGFRSVEDQSRPFLGPMVAFAVRLTPSLVLAVGVHGPASVGEGHYDHGTAIDPGPSRYLFTDMSFFYAIPTIALGFRVRSIEGLRIGIGFQPAFASAAISIYAGTVLVDEPVFDVRIDADVADSFVPAFQVGFLYQIGERIEIGAQARFSDDVEATGEVVPTAVPFQEVGGQQLPPSRVRIDVPIPFVVLRTGIRYRHPRRSRVASEVRLPPHRSELFDIELDVIYEANSAFSELLVDLLEPINTPFGALDVAGLTVEQHWRDTVALRLGGAVNLLDGDLSLSGGVFWQSAASPIEYTHLVFPAWNSVGLSFGLTVRIRRLDLTVAYSHIFMNERHVSADQGKIFALRATPRGGHFEEPAVNAGDFRGSYDILAVSATVTFGAEPRGTGSGSEL